jgi:trehalose 6-phosphate phosphatase
MNAETRDQTVRPSALWVFDFDGTLSPLVADRDAAVLHPACRDLLEDLAQQLGHAVAVLSSRSVDDLVPRVPIPHVLLGGASGLEWRFPGGHRVLPGDRAEVQRDEARRSLQPLLSRILSFPGMEVEDKLWSLAIHYRKVLPDAVPMVSPLLDELRKAPGIRVFDGPYAAEVQLLPSVNKSFGVRRLCRLLRFETADGRIAYAGDDENDAVAMRWVLGKGGAAFVVGGRVRVRRARPVDGPADLARAVREYAGLPPRGSKGRGKVEA